MEKEGIERIRRMENHSEIKILSLEQRILYRERKSIFARRVIFFFEGNLRSFDTNYVIRIICVVKVGKKGRGEVVSTSFG